MAKRYFKKASPKTKVVLLDGRSSIQFETIDGFSGYFSTADPAICDHFLDCMRKNRYGITEISQEEAEEWAKKKASSSPYRMPLREEMGPSGVVGTCANAPGTVAVKAPKFQPSSTEAAMQTPVITGPTRAAETAPVKPVFTPRTGKRQAPA